MDALGNLMLGLWFMILTGACSGMAFLIFKDHRPVRRDKLGYFVWTSVAVALIIFSMITFGIVCWGAKGESFAVGIRIGKVMADITIDDVTSYHWN